MMFLELIPPYDYIILFIALIIIIFSFMRGFINSILSLLTWIGSVIITIYSYNSLADIITKQLLKINFFSNLESYLTLPITIISIPVVFLISLFILKRIRFFISADLDKKIIGIILDKIFGLIYGVIFSCLLLSTLLIITNRYNELEKINNWLIVNSNIAYKINDINQRILNPYSLENLEKITSD